jgi:hypothetical protein
MHHIKQFQETGIVFLLIGLFIRYLLARKKIDQQLSADISWYSTIKHWTAARIAKFMGRSVGSLFFYSGIMLLLITLL